MSRGSLVPVLLAALTALAAGCASAPKAEFKAGSSKDAAHANVQLGVAYMQQGQLAIAKEKLERAETQDPQSFEVHTALASLYQRLEQPEKADRQYQQALRLSPGNPDIANNYAVYLCQNHKVDQALQQFDSASKNRLYTTPWAALTNAGVCLRSAKRGPEAVKYLEQALNTRPDYVPAVFELADLQLELNAPAAATHVVDLYLALGRVSPDVLLVGLRAALARGDRQAADGFARRLRRDFPDSVQTRALPQLLGDRG